MRKIWQIISDISGVILFAGSCFKFIHTAVTKDGSVISNITLPYSTAMAIWVGLASGALVFLAHINWPWINSRRSSTKLNKLYDDIEDCYKVAFHNKGDPSEFILKYAKLKIRLDELKIPVPKKELDGYSKKNRLIWADYFKCLAAASYAKNIRLAKKCAEEANKHYSNN